MCPSQTHEGCFVSPTAAPGFDELTCHCGASVIYPPVPCGTRPPECTQTCARIHECDHPGGSPLLASPLHCLLTPCHGGCCMVVFTALMVFRNFSAFLVTSTLGAYFKVEHMFTKLKVTWVFVIIGAVYIDNIKRKKIEIKLKD